MVNWWVWHVSAAPTLALPKCNKILNWVKNLQRNAATETEVGRCINPIVNLCGNHSHMYTRSFQYGKRERYTQTDWLYRSFLCFWVTNHMRGKIENEDAMFTIMKEFQMKYSDKHLKRRSTAYERWWWGKWREKRTRKIASQTFLFLIISWKRENFVRTENSA